MRVMGVSSSQSKTIMTDGQNIPPNNPLKLDYGLADPPRWKRPRWVIAAIVGILLMGIGFVLSTPIFTRHTDENYSWVKTEANLRMIGQGILLYTNEFRGEYPDSLGTLLLTEDMTPDELISPLRNETPATGPTTRALANNVAGGGHTSYVYLGGGLTTNTVTLNTVVAYQIPVHSGSAAWILMGDGTVVWAQSSVVAKIIARASGATRPVTLP
jgi:hypothetical protein